MPIIEYIPTYKYFSVYHDWCCDHQLLDFGSNCGNLIKSSQGKIPQKNYTAIDVDAEAIQAGREQFPLASWHCYNRHNPAYNPSYVNELPGLQGPFDVIFSYSVFSHTSWPDTSEMVDYLWNLLLPGGKMYLTICDVYNAGCVQWFRNRRINCDHIPQTDSVIYLVDNKVSETPPQQPCTHFVAFYNTQWLQRQWGSKYHVEICDPPQGWLQHCAVFEKPTHTEDQK